MLDRFLIQEANGFSFILNGAIEFLSQTPYARVEFFFAWFGRVVPIGVLRGHSHGPPFYYLAGYS